MTTKRRGIALVSFELLHDALHLVDDIECLEVSQMSADRWGDGFYLKLGGGNLPEVEEGCVIPHVTLTCGGDEDGPYCYYDPEAQ